MRRRPIPPYHQLPMESVRLDPMEGWQLHARGQTVTLPDGEPFPEWDASLEFELKRRFSLSPDAHRQLGVDSPDAIKLQLVVRSVTAGNLSASVLIRRDLSLSDEEPFEVVVRPAPGTIARDLTLETSVVFLGGAESADPLVPALPGSRVWEERWRTRLEGGKVRLPFEVVDFEAMFGGLGFADALFHVDVADDADLDFEQGVCVCINSRYEGFVQSVARLEPLPTAMLWDAVLRRVLTAGIGAGFNVSGTYPEASVGAQWRRWFGQVFPGESIESVQRLIIEQPSRFEARVQSWSRIASRVTTGLGG